MRKGGRDSEGGRGGLVGGREGWMDGGREDVRMRISDRADFSARSEEFDIAVANTLCGGRIYKLWFPNILFKVDCQITKEQQNVFQYQLNY